MFALCPDTPDTPEYYSEVARRFEELADYVRSQADLDPKIANHLEALASDILNDGLQGCSKVSTTPTTSPAAAPSIRKDSRSLRSVNSTAHRPRYPAPRRKTV